MIKVHGYFLIELLIALSIVLIISTIAIPNLNFLNQQVVASNLEKLNMTLMYMQQSAINLNKNLTLKFDNNKSYSYENFNEQLSNKVEFGIKPGVKGPPSFPVKPISSPISFTNNQIVFYNNGQIQPGTVYLIDNLKKYLYALTVPVSQVSFIRKYYFYNGKWILI